MVLTSCLAENKKTQVYPEVENVIVQRPDKEVEESWVDFGTNCFFSSFKVL